MRLVGLGLVALVLAGCSTTPYYTKPGVSQAQLASIKVSNRDCPQMDTHIAFASEQLRLRGLVNVNPEDLEEEDRLYNATAHILIWSLRIVCANPTRYER